MSLPNIFTKVVSDSLIERISHISPNTSPLRGKMNAAQMFAHCCVSFEYVFEPEKHKRPNRLMKKLISLFAKNIVVSETPFPKNSRTAPDMVMKTNHDFELEKTRLVDFINRVQKQGEAYFDGRESWGFGKLTKEQRNNLFYKHVDHHLKQFGV